MTYILARSLRGLGRRRQSTLSSPGSNTLTGLIGLNVALSSFLIYQSYEVTKKLDKVNEHLDFGMDRIDECLNRIDLRNNETTQYFQHISEKVGYLDDIKAQKKKEKK